MSDRQKIWIYLEHRDGEVTETSLGLLAEARRLAKSLGCALEAFAFGPLDTPPPAEKLYDIRGGGELEEFPGLGSRVVSGLAREHGPAVILLPDTLGGRDLGARVAAALGAGFAPACTALQTGADGAVAAVRGVCGDRLSQLLELGNDVTSVVTMLPESIGVAGGDGHGKTAEVITVEAAPSDEDGSVRLVGSVVEKAEELDIAEADVLVSGGRGLKKKENFSLLRDLAERVGGAVAGTRGAVERGWIESERQVGQTGKTVAPELYLACGLSGAPQHLMGMKNSRRVAAVNTDPHAPILRVADFAVIGDLFQIVPALIEKYREKVSG